ncbi:MAG: NAD(P)-dependent oxidoreductase, partial [Gammaproteobacteria bacterium]|nr:NAD(P)-dependent oxidoreductase [Gammaproteobacteria bacterium]
ALVANGLDATISLDGMHGLRTSDTAEAAAFYGARAKELGEKISDYILFAGAPHGVFVIAEHDEEQHGFLTHIKMGDGPFYVLTDSEVLVHLEVARMIRRVMSEGHVLLNNSSRPSINVAAVAKQPLPGGSRIEKAIGSFDLRGTAVKIISKPEAVPIGLLENAVLKRAIEPGQIVTFDDVDLQPTLALNCWLSTRESVLASIDSETSLEPLSSRSNGDHSPSVSNIQARR